MFTNGSDLVEKLPISKIRYGISYLDDATGGIGNNDFIILGGRSGSGKTSIISQIAEYNAVQGKRVHVFSLESYKNELNHRIQFRIMSKMVYDRFKENIRFRDWVFGKYFGKYKDIEKEVNTYVATKLTNLEIFYRDSEKFGAKELSDWIESIQRNSDLIIVDHLHYLDFDDPNELRAIKNILKKIRDLVLIYNKPIVLVAHLRKKDRLDSDLAPSMDEFHGTSDITKIATHVITLSQYHGAKLDTENFSTIFRVCKNRIDNSPSVFYGMHVYNISLARYNKSYKLAKIYDCIKSNEFTECGPVIWWAENAEEIEETQESLEELIENESNKKRGTQRNLFR